MSAAELRDRPLCAEVSAAADEPLAGTASRVEHWLLVEHTGLWPHDPLDAAPFAGRLRDHLAAQLASLPRSRLVLAKRPGRSRRPGILVVVGRSRQDGHEFRVLRLDAHGDLAGIDLARVLRDGEGERLPHPLLLVCTHGKRDRCCARFGQPLARALAHHAPPGWVWQSSHVGGDRFAGNVVVLPEGVYLGRVRPGDAPRILDAVRAARVDLATYRGRSTQVPAAQAAEAEVRRRTGLAGVHDVRVRHVERTGDRAWRVTVEAVLAGEEHVLDVRAEHGEPSHLTCRAARARPPRRFVAEPA